MPRALVKADIYAVKGVSEKPLFYSKQLEYNILEEQHHYLTWKNTLSESPAWTKPWATWSDLVTDLALSTRLY